jgi:sec-independent protein translocase protein TatC
MSLADHFRELRNRVLISAAAVLVAGIVGWIFYDDLIGVILQPLLEVRDARGESLVNINFGGGVTQPFSVQLTVAIFVGVVLASPVWIWQVWGFLLPGLRPKEKKIALWYFLTSVPLFFAGCLLAAWALPQTVAVLLSFTPEGAANLTDAMVYLHFILYFIVAFGIAFLLPVIMVGLNSLRLLPVRVMISGWRVALVLILVFAALVTPDPSAWTMIALSIPMFALYWCAVAVATVLERRRRRRDPDWLDVPDDEASPL